MQPEQQQRIMGYFIEEAKEHLDTIEQSLLNLQSVAEDPEMLNEVFRAAHSVKGGAAMLGIYSIQQTAHKLEDYFKILKEHSLKVDQKLESLFLRSFDTLNELLEELQGPFGLMDEVAEKALQDVEPVFAELQTHLATLVADSLKADSGAQLAAVTSTSAPLTAANKQSTFQAEVPLYLRQMLQLFKQEDLPVRRQQLKDICQTLAQLGYQFQLPGWSNVLEQAYAAIANPANSFSTLASTLIKDIKQARDLVITGRADKITASDALMALAPTTAAPTMVDTDEWASIFTESSTESSAEDQTEINLADLFAESEPERVSTGSFKPFDKTVAAPSSAEAELLGDLPEEDLATDLFGALENLFETDPALAQASDLSQLANTDDYPDLVTDEESASESLLEALTSELASTQEAFADEDLETLFKQNASSSSPGAAATEFAELEMLLDYLESEVSAADALAATTSAYPTQKGGAPSPDLAPPTETQNPQPTPALEPLALSQQLPDDFEDLEKLLEDTDLVMGGAPATGQTQAGARARPNRRTYSTFEQTMKVPVKQLDSLSNLVGELIVNRNSLEDNQKRLRQFLENLLYQVQQLSDVSQQMQELYERSLLESSLLVNSSSRSRPDITRPIGNAPVEASHATGARFDALEMDRFTTFHTLSQEIIERIVRVREAASDIEFVVEENDQVTRMFRQVTIQAQEGLTRSRMIPFAQIADRLPRAVRDLSLKCNKLAQLDIEGRETLVDKSILERLYDPMTHLVNNAIYHGIESPEIRKSLGKPPVGQIKIRAFYQGNQTVISVMDDGIGIDLDRVKAKAINKGLLTPEKAQTISRMEIYNLLLHSGFSTQDSVDELAGRGVGLDVVRASLEEMRGVLNIDSTYQRGTTFTIRLPLTLSIVKALCCIDDYCRIAFPIDGVEEMLDLPKNAIQEDSEGKLALFWQDQLIPFQPLSDLLNYHRHIGRGSVYGGSQDNENMISVVILRSPENLLAVQVDQVLGEQEIVIKQFTGPVPKPLGIAGVTVQGDGRVMAIADVLELVDLSQGRLELTGNLWGNNALSEVEEKIQPLVLIVDDSITVRELLSLTFNKVGYRVEQARDGQEAWEKIRSGLPCDLVFCDIEMPRMDGLELLARIQKDESLQNLPIAMLTSRGADRHREMALKLGARGYFTKPYLEESLLDGAKRLLNGEVLVTQSV